MGECFLYGNGGGGGLNIKEYAISVTFPVGSECTVTDGVKTFKAKTGSGGAWIFDKVYAATWTVNITQGGQSASKTVTLSTSSKTAHLDMLYSIPLFENGVVTKAYGSFAMDSTGYKPYSNPDDFNGYTLTQSISNNKWKLTLARNGTSHNQSAGIMRFDQRCDLTGVKSISIDMADIPAGSNLLQIYKTMANGPGVANVSLSKLHSELDVSGYTGTYYVCITIRGVAKTFTITDWRLVL